MWAARRRKRLLAAEFPAAWKQLLEKRVPIYARLPEADQKELHGLVHVFLDEKKFEGCAGFTITDEVKLCIASQACTLLLHRPTDFYPALKSILVYPRMYYVPSSRHIGPGIVLEREEPQLGQASRHGVILLAWDAVCPTSTEVRVGGNLVIHEFAHFLDFEDGSFNGAPLLGRIGSTDSENSTRSSWDQTCRAEFEKLRTKAERGEETFLDAYGAKNPAEFFAVVTEAFFEQPHELNENSPALYTELKSFFRQDPSVWTPERPELWQASAFFRCGYTKHERKDWAGATEDYSQAIGFKPEFAQAYFCRGDAKEKQRDFSGALADYDQAVKLDSGNPRPLLYRARLRLRLSDPAAAVADYTRAIDLDHHFAEAYYERGIIKEERGEFDGALADFGPAIALIPDGTTLLTRRGRLLYNLGRLEEALVDYRRASDLAGPLCSARFRVWLIRSRLGEFEKATAELGKELHSVPEEDQSSWGPSSLRFWWASFRKTGFSKK